MPESPESFDPYWEWLEIPPEDQPPTYYRLLGVEEFEEDLNAIDAAAKQRTAYLHPMASGPNRQSVQGLLSEVAKARRTLLAVDSKLAYDESLHAEPAVEAATPAPPLQAPPRESERVGQPASRPEMPPADEPEESVPVAVGRKKSLVNDWRIHVASASMLFIGAVGFVVYTNTRPRRVASVAASLPDSRSDNPASTTKPAGKASQRKASPSDALQRKASQSNDRILGSRPKAKRPMNGQSGLGQLLADRGFSMEATGPKDAMRPGAINPAIGKAGSENDSSGAAKNTLPNSASVELSNGWLKGLTTITDFKSPLDATFDISHLHDLLVPADGQMILKQADAGATGKLTFKDHQIGLGETVVLKTNLSRKSPADKRLGIALGKLRVNLCPKGKVLEIRINGSKAANFSAPSGKDLTLAVTRHGKDASQFHWIAQAGAKTLYGRGDFTGELSESVPIGILAASGDQESTPSICIKEFAIFF